ncbi:hypothetical protein L3i20_v244320 [Paenibacillus sp. L3-i20]|nr:hypothetical protein L3i20_v244320 [Paenibacillus sp. L3-i20]
MPCDSGSYCTSIPCYDSGNPRYYKVVYDMAGPFCSEKWEAYVCSC